MKNKKIIITIAAAMLMTTALNSAVFNNYAKAQDINTNLLANNVDGKLMLKADIGYVYSFAGDWNKSNAESPSIGGNKSTATGGVGYGASLGYTHKSGIGLSADYLGFNHKWTGLGTDVKSKTEFNYDASYHVVTLVPSYRIKLDSANNWGLRVGLGVGFSLSDVSWAQKISASNGAQSSGVKVAGGANYTAATGFLPLNVCGADNTTALAAITDSANLSTPNSCRDGALASIAGITATDFAIATMLKNAGFTQSELSAIGATTTTTHAHGISISQNATNTVGHIATPVLNSCVWGMVNGCYQANGTQYTAPAPSGGGGTPSGNPAASSGGSAKDDAGFVLAPQVALEYDNGMLHADINVKYMHELFNVRYFGSEGSVDGLATSGAITYTSIAGPLALFVGAGFGMNF
ncbi:MAG: hypothetical protein QM529_07650 [Hydrotalea sp.]|nr:hypothetical protein [Hydrotalea sp.]